MPLHLNVPRRYHNTVYFYDTFMQQEVSKQPDAPRVTLPYYRHKQAGTEHVFFRTGKRPNTALQSADSATNREDCPEQYGRDTAAKAQCRGVATTGCATGDSEATAQQRRPCPTRISIARYYIPSVEQTIDSPRIVRKKIPYNRAGPSSKSCNFASCFAVSFRIPAFSDINAGTRVKNHG